MKTENTKDPMTKKDNTSMAAEGKRVENYLHLYLGCPVECKIYDGKKLLLHRVSISGVSLKDEEGFLHPLMVTETHLVKPILRPLSDMTDEEARFGGVFTCRQHVLNCIKSYGLSRVTNYRTKPTSFHYLLSKHFDLFGLIEANLAIDSTMINTTNV